MKKLFVLPLCGSLMAVGCTLAPPQTSTAAPLAAVSNAAPIAAPINTKSVSVINPDWRGAIVADWKTPPTFGRIETSENGLKLITMVQPEKIYNLQTTLLSQIKVAKGDTLMIRFAARSLVADKATGVTKIRANFSKASPDWDSSYQGEIGLTSNWQRYDIPFTCKNDFAPGEARMTFTFGFPAQQLEIADLQVLKFGPEVSLASLPKTKRFADKIAPEVVQAELERIARMKAELAAVKDPSPANGKVIYVAKSGKATNNGSKTQPFATIPQALEIVQPGDTVEVGGGNISNPKAFPSRNLVVPMPGFTSKPHRVRGPNWSLPIGAASRCAAASVTSKSRGLNSNGSPIQTSWARTAPRSMAAASP